MIFTIITLISCLAGLVLAVPHNTHQDGQSLHKGDYTFCCLAFDSTIFKRVTVPLTYLPTDIPTCGPALIYKQCAIDFVFKAPCDATVIENQDTAYPACGDVQGAGSKNWSVKCKSLEECAPHQDLCASQNTYTKSSQLPPGAGEWHGSSAAPGGKHHGGGR